jgi:hypothetical protein
MRNKGRNISGPFQTGHVLMKAMPAAEPSVMRGIIARFSSIKWLSLVLCLCCGTAQAQVLPNLGGQRSGSAGMTHLKNDASPRSSGMASANITLEKDAFAAFTNPAAMTGSNTFSLGMSNYYFGAGVNHTFLAGIIALPNSGSAFGITFNNVSSGKQEVRTEFQPEGTGQYFYANTGAAGLGYGKKLSDQFSFGITLKYIYEAMAQYRSHTAATDLGFIYHTDVKDLAFAVTVHNFGGSSALKGDFREINFKNTATPATGRYPLPTEFKLGISMVPLKTDLHRLLAAVQLNHPNDNSENLRFGVEYAYRDLLFLRTGLILGRKSQKYPTFGVGMRTRIGHHPLHLHYALTPMNFMGLQHHAGIAFQIHKTEVRE